MNIFGLYIGSSEHINDLQMELKLERDASISQSRLVGELRASVNKLSDEVVGYKKQLATSQEREAGLQKQVDELSNLNAAAQTGRIAHNDLLYKVGKHLLKLKSAWDFRLSNPNMGPTQRQTNNKDLTESIAELVKITPKQIPDPSIAQIAGKSTKV